MEAQPILVPPAAPRRAPSLRDAAPPGASTRTDETDRVDLGQRERTSAEEPPGQAPRLPWAALAGAGVALLSAVSGHAGAAEAQQGGGTSTVRALEEGAPGLSLVALREQVARASARRPQDPPEARLARTRFALLHQELDQARDQALRDLARLGEGTHALPDGLLVTLRKDGPHQFTARYTHAEPARVQTIQARTDGSGDVRLERGERPVLLVASRQGGRMDAREFGRHSESYELEGDVLVRRTPTAETRTLPDGEFSSRPADGDVATVILPDMPSAERDAVIFARGARLAPDGSRTPLDEESRERLLEALQPYPPGVLRTLAGHGVSWLIVDPLKPPPGGFPGGNLTWPMDATGKQGAGAYYNPGGKVIVLRSDMLHQGAVVHEFAHAVDDLGAADSDAAVVYESETDPLVQGLFQNYLERSKDPAQVWSDYAQINAQEYYAKGFEFFHGPQSDRERLEKLDPGLYRFVEGRLQAALP